MVGWFVRWWWRSLSTARWSKMKSCYRLSFDTHPIQRSYKKSAAAARFGDARTYGQGRAEEVRFIKVNELKAKVSNLWLKFIYFCHNLSYFAFDFPQVGHNSYPNVMALLAGEPDVDQAEEECKQKVHFPNSSENPPNVVSFIIIPCSILYCGTRGCVLTITFIWMKGDSYWR